MNEGVETTLFISHVLSASFVHTTPALFSFGATQGEAEAEHLGDDMVSPHPSMRGGASWGHTSQWVVMNHDVAMGVAPGLPHHSKRGEGWYCGQ